MVSARWGLPLILKYWRGGANVFPTLRAPRVVDLARLRFISRIPPEAHRPQINRAELCCRGTALGGDIKLIDYARYGPR